MQAPTPGKKVEVLTQERIQSKGEHKTFDIPSNLYFMMSMSSDINCNSISHVQNNHLACMQDNGVKREHRINIKSSDLSIKFLAGVVNPWPILVV